MEDNCVYDVAVIGAGPAGTTAVLRLLQLGYKVIIIEKQVFPRFNIGESLSPGVKEILKYIGAGEIVAKYYATPPIPSHVLWETENVPLKIPPEQNHHLIVDRASFDQDLLQLCVAKGADVLQPFSAEKMTYNKDHYDIYCSSAKRPYLKVRANFIFDATGKQGVSNDVKYHIAPPTFAKSITVKNDHISKCSFLEAHPNFWLWGTTLSNDTMRFIFFCDPIKKSLQPTTEELLSQSYFGKQLREHVCSFEKSFLSYPYWNTTAIEAHCFKIGEAAFALDPLSSSGVEKAMRYALQAVIAFNTMAVKGDFDLAMRYLETKLLETVTNHVVMNQLFYNKSCRASGHSFWDKRRVLFSDERWHCKSESALYQTHLSNALKQQNLGKHTYPSTLKKEMLSQQFTLAKGIKYVKKMCVVSDYVDERLAICLPSIGREIAFINGVEVAPLLKRLPDRFFLQDLIGFWDDTIERHKMDRVIHSFLQKEIFSPLV